MIKEQQDHSLLVENARLQQRIVELEAENTNWQRQVRESKDRYRSLFENATIGVFRSTPEGKLLDVNMAGARMVGYASPCDMLKAITDLGAELYAESSDREAMLEHLRTSNSAAHMELRFRHCNGGEVITNAYIWLFRDEQGQVKYLEGFIEDITQRKQMEEALYERETLLQGLLDNSPAAIFVKDTEGRVVLANRQMEWLLQTEPGGLIGATASDLVPEAIAADLWASEQQTMHSGVSLEREEHVLRGNEVHTLLATKFPIYDDKGYPRGVGGILTDITVRKRAEQELRDKEVFIHGILDSLRSHIAVIDETGTIVSVNKAWVDFAASNPPCRSEAIGPGANYLQVCDKATGADSDEAGLVSAGIRQVLAGDKDDFYLVYPCHSPMEERWFTVRATPFADKKAGNGVPYRVVIAHHNITTQHKTEQERAALHQQIIVAQQAALRELAVPLLPLADRVLALPLVGSIDSTRAQQVMEALLDGIARHRAIIALIDITGVQTVDTQVAHALIQTAQAVKLLGAQVVLTGIGPAMAQTLVQLGTDLHDIVTRSTLQSGIAYALGKIASRVDSR